MQKKKCLELYSFNNCIRFTTSSEYSLPIEIKIISTSKTIILLPNTISLSIRVNAVVSSNIIVQLIITRLYDFITIQYRSVNRYTTTLWLQTRTSANRHIIFILHVGVVQRSGSPRVHRVWFPYSCILHPIKKNKPVWSPLLVCSQWTWKRQRLLWCTLFANSWIEDVVFSWCLKIGSDACTDDKTKKSNTDKIRNTLRRLSFGYRYN